MKSWNQVGVQITRRTEQQDINQQPIRQAQCRKYEPHLDIFPFFNEEQDVFNKIAYIRYMNWLHTFEHPAVWDFRGGADVIFTQFFSGHEPCQVIERRDHQRSAENYLRPRQNGVLKVMPPLGSLIKGDNFEIKLLLKYFSVFQFQKDGEDSKQSNVSSPLVFYNNGTETVRISIGSAIRLIFPIVYSSPVQNFRQDAHTQMKYLFVCYSTAEYPKLPLATLRPQQRSQAIIYSIYELNLSHRPSGWD